MRQPQRLVPHFGKQSYLGTGIGDLIVIQSFHSTRSVRRWGSRQHLESAQIYRRAGLDPDALNGLLHQSSLRQIPAARQELQMTQSAPCSGEYFVGLLSERHLMSPDEH
jgi:hypothetical protein